MFASRLTNSVRQFSTSALRRGHAYHGPGDNLPFDTNKPVKLTLLFGIFMATGLGIPFIAVRHQLVKSKG